MDTGIVVALILLWLFKDELAALSHAGQKTGQGLLSLGCLLAILAALLMLAGGLGGLVGG